MPALPPLALIAALSRNQVIGRDQDIPWHHPADLRYFRRLTVGHAVLMGHNTFQSLGKPLPGRTHFVLSRQPNLILPGATVCMTLNDAITQARTIDPCPFVIGGAQLYKQALPLTTLMYLTHIDEEIAGDTFFPTVDWNEWTTIREAQEGPLRFITYRRKQTNHTKESIHG